MDRLSPADLSAALDRDGYAIVPDVIDPPTVDALRAAVAQLTAGEAVRRRSGTYGIRHLLALIPEVARLAASAPLRKLIEAVLGPECFAVRGTFFDKPPDANWKLGWHQDSVIAVRQQIDTTGFGPWSTKAGICQVQPPVEFMARMVAARVHLDDCHADNAPLRVLPGSHRHGWLDDEIDDWKSRVPEVACLVPAGGVLLMRPLLLHASSTAAAPAHRRVIHLEYAAEELPGGLEWHDRVGDPASAGTQAPATEPTAPR